MFFIGSYSDYLLRLKDPNEGVSLENIPVFSNKIDSLIVRNKHKIRDMHDYAHIWGSVHLLKGLECHYEDFLSHLHVLASKDCLGDDSRLDHYAVAYLNRLGQLYYFIKSLKLLKNCPKIKELYLFRRKSTGHRSIDLPYIEKGQLMDQPSEQVWQAGCFMRRSFEGKIDPNADPSKVLENDVDIWLTPKRYLSEKAFVRYQIISNRAHATFIPQADHGIVLKEIERVYMRLFSSRS
jgi:hypothetical protein